MDPKGKSLPFLIARWSSLWIILALFIRGDLPLHCQQTEVEGIWDFHLGYREAGQGEICALAGFPLQALSQAVTRVLDPGCGRVVPDNANAHDLLGPQTTHWKEIGSFHIELDASGFAKVGDNQVGLWSMTHSYGFHIRYKQRDNKIGHLLNFNYHHKFPTPHGYFHDSICDRTLLTYWTLDDLKVLGQSSSEIDEMLKKLPQPLPSYICEYGVKRKGLVRRKHIQRHTDYTGAVSNLNPGNDVTMLTAPMDKLEVKVDWSDLTWLQRQFGAPHKIINSPETGPDCGQCYSLAISSMLTARVRIKKLRDQIEAENYSLKRLSFDELEIDPTPLTVCDTDTQGCEGGLSISSLNFAHKHLLPLKRCLLRALKVPSLIGFVYKSPLRLCQHVPGPTLARMEVCSGSRVNLEELCDTFVRVTDFGYIGGRYGNVTTEALIKEITDRGPFAVALAVDGRNPALLYYKGGLVDLGIPTTISDRAGNHPGYTVTNHAGVVVGYGVFDKEVYWKTRIMWDGEWDTHGHMWIRDYTGGINTGPLWAEVAVVASKT
eukprot:Gregarina_sp_Poly_1__2336@NODE_1623_length_3686_cov_43_129317_g1070_i0_p1_GENE_NODE_1623_length_3686_cov_43_129317_g1070_i0NODE_1623_length_3686_cov_43_129317_g1070_i0_p1_ORF_typecomplete_len547_score46_77Peptidase_C1/PF00112_23/2_7e19CathepsinC_exc/PF08773_11/2_7e06_NODE_1623_length_3686_cov_43_129317_g1070_i07852425